MNVSFRRPWLWCILAILAAGQFWSPAASYDHFVQADQDAVKDAAKDTEESEGTPQPRQGQVPVAGAGIGITP